MSSLPGDYLPTCSSVDFCTFAFMLVSLCFVQALFWLWFGFASSHRGTKDTTALQRGFSVEASLSS